MSTVAAALCCICFCVLTAQPLPEKPYGTALPRLNPCSKETASPLRSFTKSGNPKASLAPMHSLVTWHSSSPLTAQQKHKYDNLRWCASSLLLTQEWKQQDKDISLMLMAGLHWSFFCWYSYTSGLCATTQISLKIGWNYTANFPFWQSVHFFTTNWVGIMPRCGLENEVWAKNA